ADVSGIGEAGLAVVVALVRFEVALIGAAELEQVVPLDHREIVGDDLVEAVPVAAPYVLRVGSVRSQVVGGAFAADFECRAQSRNLRWRTEGSPLPEVSGVIEAEIVRGGGRDVGGQAGDEVAGKLVARRGGRGGSEGVA